MGIAIKVENLSKAYQLGEIGTGTLSKDLERYWAKLRGKEDPFLRIGETNDRTIKGESDIVWSLKDINFEIEQGDAVGIIGRNGAGKSTLLKILSRVTSPTTGSIKVKGRVASLLEVGTGFHPELTGRENIFLNGAILGMRKAEIKKHFDAIVDFSGVERYIDTPVKRYSSGMYVRLAFAVAAHLESEILVVDEVLAVGDIEFQKKCLGKMDDVRKGEGRTVLFVSHNMAAIKELCTHSILLNNGLVEKQGKTSDIISQYLALDNSVTESYIKLQEKDADIYFTSISIHNAENLNSLINNNDDFIVMLTFTVAKYIESAELSICFRNNNGVNVLFTSISDSSINDSIKLTPGKYQTKTKIRKNFLLPGVYSIDIYAHYRNNKNIDSYHDVLKFKIEDIDSYMAPYGKAAIDFSCVLENCDWNISNSN